MYLQATSDTLVLPTLVQDAIINSNPMGLPTIHPQVWVWRKHEARDQNKPPWSESPGHLPCCSSPWGAGERWIGHDKSGENQRASLIRAAVAREKTSRAGVTGWERNCLLEGTESSQKEFKRKGNYRSIWMDLNLLFKIASMDGTLNWSWGRMSHCVLIPPLACPNGCTGNPELSFALQYIWMCIILAKEHISFLKLKKKNHFFWKQKIIKWTRNTQAAWCSFIFLYSPKRM